MADGVPFGNYRLLRRLARGGMAEVFLARHVGVEGFERRVAIKRILPHLSESEEFRDMFLDEARLAAQLSHPNVVHIYDFGKFDDYYFIAMEYVDGVDLGRLIRQAKANPVPFEFAARILADVCSGLAYAHQVSDGQGRKLNLVHRDVTPQNILVTYDGVVKVVDFGIAKAAWSAGRTRPGVVKGKFAYMSPEQVQGRSLDGRSDLFTAAICFYELLTGVPLYRRDDVNAAMREIRDGKPIVPEKFRADVPEALTNILRRALSTSRDARYASAGAMQLDLERFLKESVALGTSQLLGEYLRRELPRPPDEDPQSAPAGTQRQAAGTQRQAAGTQVQAAGTQVQAAGTQVQVEGTDQDAAVVTPTSADNSALKSASDPARGSADDPARGSMRDSARGNAGDSARGSAGDVMRGMANGRRAPRADPTPPPGVLTDPLVESDLSPIPVDDSMEMAITTPGRKADPDDVATSAIANPRAEEDPPTRPVEKPRRKPEGTFDRPPSHTAVVAPLGGSRRRVWVAASAAAVAVATLGLLVLRPWSSPAAPGTNDSTLGPVIVPAGEGAAGENSSPSLRPTQGGQQGQPEYSPSAATPIPKSPAPSSTNEPTTGTATHPVSQSGSQTTAQTATQSGAQTKSPSGAPLQPGTQPRPGAQSRAGAQPPVETQPRAGAAGPTNQLPGAQTAALIAAPDPTRATTTTDPSETPIAHQTGSEPSPTDGARAAPTIPKTAAPAALDIISRPPGARVTVDGRNLPSSTPVRGQSLAPGPHRVSVDRRGYLAREVSVQLNPGEHRTLDVVLRAGQARGHAASRAPSGFLTVRTVPWSKVFEGARVLGTTPLANVPLSEGSHALTFVNPDLPPVHRSVTVRAGEEARLSFELKK